MRTNRIYVVPAALSLAAIGVVASLVRREPNPESGELAWWVPVVWLVAVVVIAGMVRAAKVRAARIAIAVVLLPVCYLLLWFGGLMFLPAVLALLGAAVLGPGRPLAVSERPAMPGPWTARP